MFRLPPDPADFDLKKYNQSVHTLRRQIEKNAGQKFDPLIERISSENALDIEFMQFNKEALPNPTTVDALSIRPTYNDLKKAGLINDPIGEFRRQFDGQGAAKVELSFKYEVS